MLFVCMVSTCAELCVLKPLQAIGDNTTLICHHHMCGQKHASVQAFALKLGAQNLQGKNFINANNLVYLLVMTDLCSH